MFDATRRIKVQIEPHVQFYEGKDLLFVFQSFKVDYNNDNSVKIRLLYKNISTGLNVEASGNNQEADFFCFLVVVAFFFLGAVVGVDEREAFSPF